MKSNFLVLIFVFQLCQSLKLIRSCSIISVKEAFNKIINIVIHDISHEGWQRKSFVERSETKIAADSLTRSFYGGACPNKKENLKVKLFLLVGIVVILEKKTPMKRHRSSYNKN